jgi:PilZ domain
MGMKRRNRKRNSNAANPSRIASIAEERASPSTFSSDAEKPARSSEIPSDEEKIASFSEIVCDVEEFVASPEIPSDTETLAHSTETLGNAENSTGPSIPVTGADRRVHPRYEFTAAVEVLAADSGARIEMRVRDLSQQGCYVDTSDVLPLGTVTDVRIKKGAQVFEAHARVVYSRATKGMGLVFTGIEPEPQRILETWLAESRETSWLAANRRRSQRVLMTIPVRVSGKSGGGSPFDEDTHTRAISAHGALILVSTKVYRGQRLTLSNVQTKAALECVVAHIDRRQSDQPQVGVEFVLPNPMFWHVAFPPKDWSPRHPDAKSRIKSRESS